MEKDSLPPYSAGDYEEVPSGWGLRHLHNNNFNNNVQGYRHGPRRRVRRRFAGLVALALFIGYAHWRSSSTSTPQPTLLSVDKLQQDLQTCALLKAKPQDASGIGRARNARSTSSHGATLIRNATVWIGAPDEALAAGLSPAELKAGHAFRWTTADIFVKDGLIQHVATEIGLASLETTNFTTYDAAGRQVTAGIIDMHSHAGVDSLPELRGNDDTNEVAADITPYVRSRDGIQPKDKQIQVIKSGGVTTSLVLPGSANNIGGEAFVIKHAVGVEQGRAELSIASLLAAPDAPELRYIKMACGENPKRVYGKSGEHGPTSRLGEAWEFRHAFEQAAAVKQAQDDWCATAEQLSASDATGWTSKVSSYLPQEIRWETLAAVLRGQVFVNTHCYTVPDLESFVGYTNEFEFPVRAFHHAHQTFLVPEILKRAWGADIYGAPASALFADNMYYKAESAVASEYAGKILWDNDLTPIYVSDNPVLNAQHVLFEAAKAYRYGLPYHAALASVTTAPAERLGLGNRIGRLQAGYDADIVVWDSDPLSVGAAPIQVWIDGVPQYEDPVELAKPKTGPLQPDEKLATIPDEPIAVDGTVVFTGVKDLLVDHVDSAAIKEGSTVVVHDGKITCVGTCKEDVAAARAGKDGQRLVELANGYVAPAYTAFGSFLGLNEIDAERDTDNGNSDGDVFSRGVDGLAFGGLKLNIAHRYGVTRAVSAPKFRGGFSHYGTSAGFLTGVSSGLEDGAVFATDASVHYTLTSGAKHGSTPSLSAAIGVFRKKLLKAIKYKDEESDYSEDFFLHKVVSAEFPLVVTVHSADTIASVLKVKAEVEAAAKTSLKLVILGGAESHLVADALAAAHVGVVLAPLQSYASSWDQRRALTGAPLTNGTAVDVLLDAGVTVAIGLEEDWLLRDLGLLAGIAYHNGGGRLSEKEALALVSGNIDKLLGFKTDKADFVVHEGHPLQIDSRIKAVSAGQGTVTLV
ncbi:carbohydrate esterase family 9 protein [Ophiostoma piceae UAMH 11346]|uniref:Carbohydrate esterase family 9 protein n=1 Tax=Ophiostoma piceae (strain UAMH 11346) TaxID=1262450 RepID=S3D8K5_OPHP1|nr:carbohydrate esterase family 9 protein [Ophiostoma piceae UAMH 11346]